MATEKRLIDAYACPCIKCDRLEKCRPGICESFAEWWFASVDAVEVVRCKNCKEKFEYGPNQFCCFLSGMPIDEDDFCSLGSKMDGEEA